jgi:opacity protein-like surface antigen
MIKKIIPLVTALTLSTSVMAQEMTEHENAESKFYVVGKALYILGDTIGEEEGNGGAGFGIDFGYRLEYGLSVEYDFSYSTNTIDTEAESLDADYMTHAIDLIYTYKATQELGVFAKVGYEYESETIEDEDASDTGAVFGAGVEYELSHLYSVVGEYEHSTIDGPRGDSIYLGLMVNF